VDALGLLVGLVGFGLTLWQLARTKRAAEAARDSAAEAVRGVRFVQAVATLQDISARSRDLTNLLRERKLSTAARAAFDLREAIARFQPSDSAPSNEDWTAVLEQIISIHNRLESLALSKRVDVADRETLIHECAAIHSKLSAFAARTTLKGDQNANP
jgi:hypothetical protein